MTKKRRDPYALVAKSRRAGVHKTKRYRRKKDWRKEQEE